MDKQNPVCKAARDLKAARLRVMRRRERAAKRSVIRRTGLFPSRPKKDWGLWEDRAK
jgi:hypothetical protein